ncbi:MAG: tRNA pseudouridine(13) synthase TruD [Candidatus Marsarchaeota archaeon]|nr:tRNA pseudouridine(13) synthase TruD [Candidatus Marsarchaeota archaeon]
MDRLSKSKRIIGDIKSQPSDFIVEEISENGTILKLDSIYTPETLGFKNNDAGKFAAFIMQKENWNTLQALREITKKVGRGIKSVSFAGTKDRSSISTQMCAIYGIKSEQLSSMHIKDIKINGHWQSDKPIKLGSLLGNHFIISISNSQSEDINKINEIEKELNGLFPNLFGSQRFGNRNNNVDVGINIMLGNFEEAAMHFLTDTSNETNIEAIEARIRLKAEKDYKSALNYFPKYLKYERMVIEYLSMYPNDYANALRKIPRQISLMFVHSVQSHIFNLEISKRIFEGRILPEDGDLMCGINKYGFPDLSKEGNNFIVGMLVGHDSIKINEHEKSIMETLGISIEDFKIKRMPELNCKGKRRVLFAPYKDFKASIANERLQLEFSLPSGVYATSMLNEFLENSNIEQII